MLYHVDFLIVGSGISGLYAAHLLSQNFKVLLVTKSHLLESNTYYAQGGIASVLQEDFLVQKQKDDFKQHIEDTMKAGAYLNDPDAVELLITQGPKHIEYLMKLGVEFSKDKTGHLSLHKEGGHSKKRVVHVNDFTGQALSNVLARVVQNSNIQILEYCSVLELITQNNLDDVFLNPYPEFSPAADNQNEQKNKEKKVHENQKKSCYGAYLYSRKHWNVFPIFARNTILASGGVGQVYLHSTNPEIATGDGLALAYRAGAKIANMEFYQFHPTALYEGKSQSKRTFLISEILRGAGAKLLDRDGKSFMQNYDPAGDLAARDVIALSMDREMKKSGSKHLWLDISFLPKSTIKKQFPNIYDYCLHNAGLDIAKKWIPVVPAAHYSCGGILADTWGRTSLNSLFAIGEVACTGVHGGNRLASNSLLEGLVFAGRLQEYFNTHSYIRKNKQHNRDYQKIDTDIDLFSEKKKENMASAQEWILVEHNLTEIKNIMWDYVGIVRSDLRLKRASSRIALLQKEIEDYFRKTAIQNKILELRNLAVVANLIIQSSMLRKINCGLYYNIDRMDSSKISVSKTKNEMYTILSLN